MRKGYITLSICILILFACTPTKVKIYPKETQAEKSPPDKSIPQKTISEGTIPEETIPEATVPEETIPKDTIPERPILEKTIPEETLSERTSQEAAAPGRTISLKPPSEKATETISIVEPAPEKTYAEAVAEWKSNQDLTRWMEEEFSFDAERYRKFEGTFPIPRTPQETFKLKSGIYIDAAMFLKETLNRINPSYQAQIVVLILRPHGFNHYVCSFRQTDRLFIMDYGTPYAEVTGVHGPYHSLEEYKEFYEKHHPMRRQIEAISYLP